MKITELTSQNSKRRCQKKSELPGMSFRVCINCYGIRVYPYMGFMVGQRYQCQDCQEQMVIPLEFDTQEDYEAFAKQMGVAVNDQEE